MNILPAIDLKNGKCVRLIQGEYDKQINYEDDPVKQAGSFVSSGAIWLHLIDLDGAKLGKPYNTDAVKAVCGVGGLKIEIGGGIRQEEHIRQMLDLGVYRVIIGTSAINEFDWFCEMAEKFPKKLSLALDARGSKLASHGWTRSSETLIHDFALEAAKLPIATIIYTDISKDGMLSGPNIERTQALVDALPNTQIIASGGIATIQDIKNLAKIKAAGAIIGRALYEGNINLQEAILASK